MSQERVIVYKAREMADVLSGNADIVSIENGAVPELKEGKELGQPSTLPFLAG